MKYIFILFMLVLFYSKEAYCQHNKDSVTISFAEGLKQQLNLSDSEVAGILIVCQRERAKRDSIDEGLFSPQDRAVSLQKMMQEYRQSMKAVLAQEHWQQYLTLWEDRKKELIKNKKIKVPELDSTYSQ